MTGTNSNLPTTVAWMLIVMAACVVYRPLSAGADTLPIIDAHSQFDGNVDPSRIIQLMGQAGVVQTILSARGRVSPEQVAALAGQYPRRIVAALRTKGGIYSKNKQKYYVQLSKQAAMPAFRAMAEVIMWHAAKGNKADKVVVFPTDKRVSAALAVANARKWPFIPHIEYAAAGAEGDPILSALEVLFDTYRDQTFLLIHMGQLPFDEVDRLITTHRNVGFLVSHSNPVSIAKSAQPWTNLFDGDTLSPRWLTLMTRHPDRFVLNFDNVFAEHWGAFYLDQVALWRKALAGLPHDSAHMIAHRNAERLWRLDPH